MSLELLLFNKNLCDSGDDVLLSLPALRFSLFNDVEDENNPLIPLRCFLESTGSESSIFYTAMKIVQIGGDYLNSFQIIQLYLPIGQFRLLKKSTRNVVKIYNVLLLCIPMSNIIEDGFLLDHYSRDNFREAVQDPYETVYPHDNK